MRWGVLATGKISSDFCNAILHDEQADVVGIGSRSIESANRFSERHGLLERGVKCYGSYEELLKDPQVDVVYVGSINTSHFTNVIACLQHGKHVLCEKPLGVNLAQVKQMIELAKEKKLFLGEGMWTRSFPAAQKVRDILSSKVLGEVVTCQGDLGFDIPPSVSRCYDLHQGGGALLDLGVYPLAWVLLAFQGRPVVGVSASATIHSETGVDVTGCVTVKFGGTASRTGEDAGGILRGGGIGTATYSFGAETQNEVWIVCTKGKIHVRGKSAHTPEKLTITTTKKTSEEEDATTTTEELTFPIPSYKCPTPMNFMNSHGFIYEVQHVEECLRGNLQESSHWSLQESRQCAEIMDKVRSIIGVKYPMDE